VPVREDLLVLYPPARALRRCAAMEAWAGVLSGLGVFVQLEVVERLGAPQLAGNTIVPDETRERDVEHGCDGGAQGGDGRSGTASRPRNGGGAQGVCPAPRRVNLISKACLLKRYF